MQTAAALQSTGLVITNPLVLYRTLLATQRIQPDEAQHRLAIHLQKLYDRLKDYSPEIAYRERLDHLASSLQSSSSSKLLHDDSPPVGADATAAAPLSSFLSQLRTQRAEASSLALTRQLTSHEAAMQMRSPKGLLLHGDVGTGKSMLVDLLAESLPTARKRRWHFNTFMLEAFARLERLRRGGQGVASGGMVGGSGNERAAAVGGGGAEAGMDTAQSALIVLLAKGLVEEAPVVFLDEFQLPDRASAKILTSLFTAFFRMGGVLVATSNRLPEELAKASGVEFGSVPSEAGSLWNRGRKMLGLAGGARAGGGLFGGQSSDFAAFLDVLKARCEIWDMNGMTDWRRAETHSRRTSKISLSSEDDQYDSKAVLPEGSTVASESGIEANTINGDQSVEEDGDQGNILPIHYHTTTKTPSSLTSNAEEDLRWQRAVLDAISSPPLKDIPVDSLPWQPVSLRVYGRDVRVSRALRGVTIWTFPELCGANLGPADYISLASTFHTFVLTDVPVLSLLQKNEARRFITLLDALYEARCKLLIRAAAGPDDIFFPEIKPSAKDGTSATQGPPQMSEDGTYAETFSEIYQDRISPFRPNISTYEPSASSPNYAATEVPSSSTSRRSMLADEDSDFRSEQEEEEADFGPVYGAGRSSSPSPSSYSSSSLASTLMRNTHHRPRGPADGAPGAGHEIGHSSGSGPGGGLNFQRTEIFTGEDERFAYKRARSRLWEMCGRKWWERGGSTTATTDGINGDATTWWRPLPKSSRAWETSINTPPTPTTTTSTSSTNPPTPQQPLSTFRPLTDAEGDPQGLFRHGASPFRKSQEPPPKFTENHAWGMMTWGKKAGVWGRGVDALKDKKGDGKG